MQFSTILAFAAAALSTAIGVSASPDAVCLLHPAVLPLDSSPNSLQHLTTLWVPTATAVVTNTYTGTRVEEVWTNVPPYEWETTFPITWTAVKTQTEFMPVVTSVPQRRHARDFEQQ